VEQAHCHIVLVEARLVAGAKYFIFAVTCLVCFADLMGRSVLARQELLHARPFFIEILNLCPVCWVDFIFTRSHDVL
jgi:hypothetical protein